MYGGYTGVWKTYSTMDWIAWFVGVRCVGLILRAGVPVAWLGNIRGSETYDLDIPSESYMYY